MVKNRKIFSNCIVMMSLFCVSLAQAKKSEHRHHEAHVHGAATVNIAIDQTKGQIEINAAAMGVLGFEHAAKTEKDKKILLDQIAFFEKNINQLIQFSKDLGCQYHKVSIDQVVEEGGHSDFKIVYGLECAKSVKGSVLNFDFTSLKSLKDIDVTVLVDDVQKSIEIKSKPISVTLK